MHYQELVDDALRGVVRRALGRVAASGLPGNHHLYLSFRSHHPGVRVPDHLRERYPDEITIVLQHQFWGLAVAEEGFEVTLSFNGVHEPLSVPFAALTGFVDPSVRFGLQFGAAGENARADDGRDGTAGADAEPDGTAGADAEPGGAAEGAEADGSAEGAEGAAAEGEKIVTLDRFRKK